MFAVGHDFFLTTNKIHTINRVSYGKSLVSYSVMCKQVTFDRRNAYEMIDNA
jgi:hypothetical protein